MGPLHFLKNHTFYFISYAIQSFKEIIQQKNSHHVFIINLKCTYFIIFKPRHRLFFLFLKEE